MDRTMTHDPTLESFYNDMNQHGSAEYKRIAPRTVIELDSYPTGWRLVVWQAVKNYNGYAPPENDKNTYAWDAVGEKHFDEYDDGKSAFNDLTTVNKVEDFTSDNPYDGPRSPYQERNE